MTKNKIVYGNETLMDLTEDTVDPSKVLLNETFHDKSGAQQLGTLDPYVPTDSAETTIADDDYFPFYDTSASGKKKTLWSNIKAILKIYFDTIYSTFSGNYNDLANRPTIPTVNDGQLTIQQNGTNKVTFTANQSGNATANIVTDDWVATSTVSNGTISFSGIDDSGNYAYKPFAKITTSSTNKNPSAQISTLSGEETSSMSITYTTDADDGTIVELRRIK